MTKVLPNSMTWEEATGHPATVGTIRMFLIFGIVFGALLGASVVVTVWALITMFSR